MAPAVQHSRFFRSPSRAAIWSYDWWHGCFDRALSDCEADFLLLCLAAAWLNMVVYG